MLNEFMSLYLFDDIRPFLNDDYCAFLDDMAERVSDANRMIDNKMIIYDKRENKVISLNEYDNNRNSYIIFKPQKITYDNLIDYMSSDMFKYLISVVKNNGKIPYMKVNFCNPKLLFYMNLVIEGNIDEIEMRKKLVSESFKQIGPSKLIELDMIKDDVIYKDEIILESLLDDVKELNACYQNNAYKATLILAGSILEAFLIDWLSEIDGKNYFEEDYYVKRYNNSTNAYEITDKRGNLVDYINAIKYINRPNWMDEAEKAHTIRRKRNYVHVKCCLDKNMKLNDATCKLVIDYLVEIINTRYQSKYNVEYTNEKEIITQKISQIRWE